MSEALADPSLAKRVSVREGRTMATDGPLAEAKEQLAGFFLVECESTERAVEVAARVPEAELALIEVRPIMGPHGVRDVSSATAVEDLLRDLAPQVLGVHARGNGDFDASEDAVQEALLAAALQWPAQGVPRNPKGWLIRAALPQSRAAKLAARQFAPVSELRR